MIIKTKPLASFSGTKALDGIVFKIRIDWCDYAKKYYMKLESVDGTINQSGIALLPGFDLLEKYGISELGQLYLVDKTGKNGNPIIIGFGTRWVLEYTPKS